MIGRKQGAKGQRPHTRLYALAWVCLLTLGCVAMLGGSDGALWPGFEDASRALHTDRYSFGGSNAEAGTENENYYDGDMGDIDGDRLPDRIMGSRYGLLHNQGGGEMITARKPLGFLLRGDSGARDWGDDATQFADIDGDGDLDAIMGGNNEALVAQLNQAGRFSIAWIERGREHSALNIVNTDIEGDGDVDLVTAHAFCATQPCGGPVAFNLYVNDGTGRFEEEAAARGLAYADRAFVIGVASGDLDGDGDFDLVIAHGAKQRLEIAFNDGLGHYSIAATTIPTSCSGFPESISLGDVDDDGDLDIAYGRCGAPYAEGHPRLIAALALNDGQGRFLDVSRTHWNVSTYSGPRERIESQQAKLVDIDYDGDLDFLGLQKRSGSARMHLIVMRNSGDGHMHYDATHSLDVPGPDSGLGADLDIADLDGDGSYDAWLGLSGGDVRILLNRHVAADGLPADRPRALSVVAASEDGIELRFEPPLFAATARRYRVYRAHAPGLDDADRSPIKDIALSLHEDEAFVAPISRHTPSEALGDPDVSLEPRTGALRVIDRTAIPGVTYHYSVAHIGAGSLSSAQTRAVPARIPAPERDRHAPALAITSPDTQTWSRWPRIALHYGDDVSGIDPERLHVSFDVPLGDRPAHANLVDLAMRHDAGAFIAYLAPPLSLPLDTLVTLSARISDRAGKTRVEQVRFFVSVDAVSPPRAHLEARPLGDRRFSFSGAKSQDADGMILGWEWYFGDGSSAIGRDVHKRFASPGEYTVRLRVRDNEGGVDVAEQGLRVGLRVGGDAPDRDAAPVSDR